jgi:N6-L-threonylcarbamoyladenine synthase
MTTNLAIGMDTAKGLSVAWGVPFIGVHHMQAHALTPQLVTALNTPSSSTSPPRPHFPFLSLLVSGGHTQLVLSTNLTTHRIIATTLDSAIGNVLDQTARLILPPSLIASSADVMYGRLLESFAFPPEDPDPYSFFKPCASRGEEMIATPTGYGWTIPLPFRQSREVAFSFSSIYSTVDRITTSNPSMSLMERRALARQTLSSSFQHLIGRICLAIEADPATLLPALRNSLVVAGGVASNKFLMHVLRETLKVRVPELGAELEVVSPPVELCTDNAAMIAWAGMEMFENGWCTDLGATPVPKWPMDPGHGSGLLGVDGWLRRDGFEQVV